MLYGSTRWNDMNDILPKIVEVEWQTEDEVIDTSVAGEKNIYWCYKRKEYK